jgi:hypothetical protein
MSQGLAACGTQPALPTCRMRGPACSAHMPAAGPRSTAHPLCLRLQPDGKISRKSQLQWGAPPLALVVGRLYVAALLPERVEVQSISRALQGQAIKQVAIEQASPRLPSSFHPLSPVHWLLSTCKGETSTVAMHPTPQTVSLPSAFLSTGPFPPSPSPAQAIPLPSMTLAAPAPAADGGLLIASGAAGRIRRLAPVPLQQQARQLAAGGDFQVTAGRGVFVGAAGDSGRRKGCKLRPLGGRKAGGMQGTTDLVGAQGQQRIALEPAPPSPRRVRWRSATSCQCLQSSFPAARPCPTLYRPPLRPAGCAGGLQPARARRRAAGRARRRGSCQAAGGSQAAAGGRAAPAVRAPPVCRWGGRRAAGSSNCPPSRQAVGVVGAGRQAGGGGGAPVAAGRARRSTFLHIFLWRADNEPEEALAQLSMCSQADPLVLLRLFPSLLPDKFAPLLPSSAAGEALPPVPPNAQQVRAQQASVAAAQCAAGGVLWHAWGAGERRRGAPPGGGGLVLRCGAARRAA